MSSINLIKIAKRYISAGFSPIPLYPGEKRPLLTGWAQYKDNTIGFEETQDLFANTTSIGLVCGFDGLEVLDIDSKHFEGDEMKRFLLSIDKEAPGLKSKMLIQDTVNGGQHWIYKCDEIDKSLKLARNTEGRATFETRGIGAQIVAYPSPGYNFKSKKQVQRITPAERALLHSCSREMDAAPEQVVGVALDYGLKQEKDNTPWGDYRKDHNSLDELLKHGWRKVRENDRFIYMKRPGETKAQDSGRIFKDSDIFWPWTTSTPFQHEKPYDCFSIFLLLEHNDDIKSATADLSARGFGRNYNITLPEELLVSDLDYEEIGELQERLDLLEVDSTKIIKRPPIAIEVVIGISRYIFGTLGNFSLVQGKAKSRKSFFVSSLAAAGLSDNRVAGALEGYTSGKVVVYIDTEQGEYHAHRTKSRILQMAGMDTDINHRRLRYFQFRGLERNSERMKFVEYALQSIDDVGLILLDGVVDLSSKGVNDEEEATEIASRLLKWTSHYKCHAVCVLHENKNDGNAKGHLGAYLTQKAESVISVRKHEENKESSIITAEYTRNMEFPILRMDVDLGVIDLSEQEAETFYKHEWQSSDLEELSLKVEGKSKNDAIYYIRDIRDVQKKEAIKAINLMEEASLIEWKGKRPKIIKSIPPKDFSGHVF